jgi:hypothetical protein
MRPKLCITACLLAVVLADPRYGCLPENSSHPWCDSSKSPLERATALVSLLTPAELVAQMDGNMPAIKRLGVPAYTYGVEALHGPIMVRHVAICLSRLSDIRPPARIALTPTVATHRLHVQALVSQLSIAPFGGLSAKPRLTSLSVCPTMLLESTPTS